MNPIDLFISIPGPDFLWIFAALCALCIALAYFWPTDDDTENDPLPPPDLLNPVEIAYLRGGTPAVLQAACFDCWARGELELISTGRSAQVVKSLGGVKPCGEVEAVILKATRTESDASQLLKNAALLDELDGCLAPVQQKLLDLRLLRTEVEQRAVKRPFWMALAVIGGVGAIRLYVGLTHDRPVFYLICLIGLALFVWQALRKSKCGRQTKLGTRYLTSLAAFYEPIKAQAIETKIPEGTSFALLPAVFGLALLQDIGPFSSFKEAFAPAHSGLDFLGGFGDSGGSDGGGSDGGGCGGGGCGGGGCGGGGCGG